MRFRTLVLMGMSWLLPGCAGAAVGAVSNAVINTAVAGTVSGVRRATGDCYTVCNPGSSCNRTTGLCDPLPCGGRCNFDEKCESSYTGDKCVSAKAVPAVTP